MVKPVVLLLVIGMAGCAGQQATSDGGRGLTTPMAKEVLLHTRSRLWKDPDSIRDARVGEAYACPRHGGFSGQPTTCICIELNAKNSFGGFTGAQKKVAVFHGSGIDDIKDWDLDDRCEAMVPFPEFNGGYVPPKPAATPKPRRS